MARLRSADQNSFDSTNSFGATVGAFQDPREVIADRRGRYYGIEASERSLIPDNDARRGETRFVNWLLHAAPKNGPAGGASAGEERRR